MTCLKALALYHSNVELVVIVAAMVRTAHSTAELGSRAQIGGGGLLTAASGVARVVDMVRSGHVSGFSSFCH